MEPETRIWLRTMPEFVWGYTADDQPVMNERAWEAELASGRIAAAHRVRLTAMKPRRGKLIVSTVFLAHDLAFGMADRQLLYETMVFKRVGDAWQSHGAAFRCRYATRAEAIAGHRLFVAHLHRWIDRRRNRHGEWRVDAAASRRVAQARRRRQRRRTTAR